MTEDKIRAKVQMGILKPAGEIFEAIVNPEKCAGILSPAAREEWKAEKHLPGLGKTSKVSTK